MDVVRTVCMVGPLRSVPKVFGRGVGLSGAKAASAIRFLGSERRRTQHLRKGVPPQTRRHNGETHDEVASEKKWIRAMTCRAFQHNEREVSCADEIGED